MGYVKRAVDGAGWVWDQVHPASGRMVMTMMVDGRLQYIRAMGMLRFPRSGEGVVVQA